MENKKQNTHLDLIDLKKMSGGRDYFSLPKEERLKICQQIIDHWKRTLPNFSKSSEKTPKDLQ